MAKKAKSKKFIWIGMTVVFAIAIIVLFAINFMPKQESNDSVAFIVNGENVFMNEVDTLYERGQYAGSKYDFISEVMIPQKLLLQEAEENGITVEDTEVDEQMLSFLMATNMSQEEFEGLLAEQGLTVEELNGFLRERLILDKLAEQILTKAEVTDEEAENFYNENPEMFMLNETSKVDFEEVKADIKTVLVGQKEQAQFQEHIDELKKNADIKINKKIKEETVTA